ncbi:IS66 family insertion sequence element accessory protein TnpB, partial [Siccirubricoccus deserti]
RQVQEALGQDPFSGQLFVFRGRRGDLVKALWWDGQGLVLYAKARHRGLAKIDWQSTFAMAAYNLVRLPKLLGAAPS